MSVSNELKQLADAYASKKITRRTLWKGAAALGLSAPWIVALEKGATAGPAQTWNQRGTRNQDKATTFIIAVEGDIDTFDPGNTVGSKTAQTVLQNIFDQLTQYQIVEKQAPDGSTYRTVDPTQVVPMMCEEWHWDGNKMVFTMRDGAQYANGNPIDANTMVAGYTRIFEGTISSWLIAMGGTIKDSSAFQAPDPKTFVIELTQQNPLTPQNNVMHNNSIVDPKEVEANKTPDDPWAKEYFKKNLATANGPYKLESYKPGDSITLVTNDLYYGEKPKFSTVILKIIPEPIQRVQLLRNGDVDFSTLIPFKELETLKSDPNLKILLIPSDLINFIEMNGKIAPFDNKLVRQAVAYATPYHLIIDQVYQGNAQQAGSIVPNGMPTSDFSAFPYSTNPEKAKELLAQAGFPGGQGLPEIKLSYRVGNDQWEKIAILMQAALKQVGMDVKIEPLAYAASNEAEQGKKLQFWVTEWISWVKDPYYHLSWLGQSESVANYPNLSNPRVDEIIAQFTLAPVGPEREAASKEAQALIADECNYVYLCQPHWTVFLRNDIDGYVYYNDELPRYYHFFRAGA
ncbi:MAG: peptide/nickel transport system substrate-binding protein [Thermomicrobiales bacterium]|nr:peptide/nickel transport system substrate-binding protein [Thermomicrobiales bacterium]